ncbi:MAG: HNH endonuclease, partial [Candidatus Thiodiazotropha sp. (ex Lucinoma annulata)]|nr:HNH endonuclease [Candidatus Thiodiazotropha sp. (ex Lucinoma annulata)]
GATQKILVNSYERSSAAREVCIRHYKAKCAVCDFDFGHIYGELGDGYIHVHHLIPLSEIGSEYEVDPINDMIPICPNCHAMIHETEPPMSVVELGDLVSSVHENSKL